MYGTWTNLSMAAAPLAMCMCIGCATQSKSYVSPRRPVRRSAPTHSRRQVSRPAPLPKPAPTAGGTVVKVDGHQNFQTEVLAAPTPAVVMFYIPWCHSCKGMKPVYQSMVGTFAGRIKFTKVNLATNRDLVAKYNISGAPTFILFKAGHETNRLVGPQPAPVLHNALEALSRR